MKRLTMLFAALMVAVMSFAADKTVVLTVNPQMHCGGCVARVTKALKADAGVKDVSVDLEKQAITVSYDDAATNVDGLIKDLAAAKYEAKVVEAAAQPKGGCACGNKAAEQKQGGCCGGDKAEQKQGGCCGGDKAEKPAAEESAK